MRHLVLALLVSATCGVVEVLPAQLPAPTAVPVVLSPGDSVRITVWRNQELSGAFAIGGDGGLTHPLYRGLKIAGLSVPAAEARVLAFLKRFEADPQFVLQPFLRVALGGEVRRPGLFTLGPETSIAQAVVFAGGPTEQGRRDQVRLTREGKEVIVDLHRPGPGWAQMPIRSGDQLVVDRRRSFVRDVFVPVMSVFGGVASVVLAIDRFSRR